MFSAISGLKVNQTMLDVTANDLTNVNTIGYKSARTTFQDSLAQLQRGAAGANRSSGGSNALQVGLDATATPDGSGGFTYAPGTRDSYITIPPGSTDVTIGQDGGVSYIDQSNRSATFGKRVTAGYLALAKFSNEGGLQRSGGSLWLQSASSGAPTVGTPSTSGYGQTNAGMVEMSNVDLATQFTTMITAQRGFQANSRVISTADEMLQDLVNLKR
jgi:flagellar hook protein FlgE